jgi:hypothetical protein
MSRILLYLLERDGTKKITRQELVSTLGIPDRQVENLTSMMTGFGLVNPRITTLTPFGKDVIQHDPYFERKETLWIIHYIVSSNPDWVVWYRIINTVLPSNDVYSVEQVSRQYFSDLAIHFSDRSIKEKLPNEVGAVFAAYSRSDLSRLGILEAEANGNFKKTNPGEVPDLAFLFCLLHYRDKHTPGSSAINTEDICTAEYSPGRVLHLPEYQVRTVLENLYNAEYIRIEQLANLDQVRLSDAITQDYVLRCVYRGNNDN